MNKLLSFKFTIIYVTFFTIGSLASSISLAFEHVNFNEMHAEDWLIIVCLILGNFANTMMAFMMQHFKKYLQEFLSGDNTPNPAPIIPNNLTPAAVKEQQTQPQKTP